MTNQTETVESANEGFIRQTEVKIGHEQSLIHHDVDINIPANHLELFDNTMKTYKKWLKENEALQQKADDAETEEERKEALKERSYHFKQRYAGVLAKDTGVRLSPSKLKKMWEKFITKEYREFFSTHLNLTMKDILDIGIDKFIYVMGWTKPSDVPSWRNNKVRIGYCCNCKDQFIPMLLQANQGLCIKCRPEFSVEAMRLYISDIMANSARYTDAKNDLMMDFHIMFYSDPEMRELFKKDNPFVQSLLEKKATLVEETDAPDVEE